MNNVCKGYMAEVKSFFPIRRKDERLFMKKLASDVEDYCLETKVTDKKELYDNYGKPNDVVNNYLSSVNTEYISKQIRISKFVKTLVASLIALATIVTAVVCVTIYYEHEMDKRQEAVICNKIIEEYN